MAKYTYTIQFKAGGRTNVEAVLTPPPTAPLSNGDEITFTSNAGPWHVIYPDSPFHLEPGNTMLSGDAGQQIKRLVYARSDGHYKFRCLIDDVGWGDAGGDTNVKTT